MGFLPLNAKPGKKGKLRPIIRDQWDEDRTASAQLAANNGGRAFLKGPDWASQRRFASTAAGQQLSGSGLGGGTFSPTSNAGTVAGGGPVHN